MDNKVIIVIAVVAVVAIAAVAVFAMNNGSDNEDKIIYEGNGGKLSNGKTSYEESGTKVSECAFTILGGHFASWNTKANGSGTKYMPGDSVPGTTTLYAQWSSSNTMFGTNEASQYVSIYVCEKGKTDGVKIDNGYAEVPADASFVVKLTMKGAVMYYDDSDIVVEENGTRHFVKYTTGTDKVYFLDGKQVADDTLSFDIVQDEGNLNIMLGCVQSSGGIVYVEDVIDAQDYAKYFVIGNSRGVQQSPLAKGAEAYVNTHIASIATDDIVWGDTKVYKDLKMFTAEFTENGVPKMMTMQFTDCGSFIVSHDPSILDVEFYLVASGFTVTITVSEE